MPQQSVEPADSTNCCMVGLGGLEPPTSSLSGMRSSHLSYRPRRPAATPGGAGRDRTGDLLNANQALSQLSYSPKRNQSRPVGCRDSRDQLLSHLKRTPYPKWRYQSGLTILAVARIAVWSGTAVSYSDPAYINRTAFRKLHPRSLLERR